MKLHQVLWAALPALTLGTTSCLSDSPFRPERSALAVSEGWANREEALLELPEGGRFWLSFGDEELNQRIERVLSANPDLDAAWRRLSQADLAIAVARAGGRPEVNVEARANRQRFVEGDGTAGGTSFGARDQEFSQYRLTPTLNWELDLWGRIRAGVRAAEQDAAAARLDAESTALLLVADTVESWISAREQASILELLGEQIATSDAFTQLTEARFEQGQGSALDVLQSRGQAQGLRADVPQFEGELSVFEHRLDILAGQAPGTTRLASTPNLPEAPGLAESLPGPAHLLEHRPDVLAAWHRLLAADERIAVAVRDRLPALRVSFTYTFLSSQVKELFDDQIANLVGTLTTPVTDGGRRRSEAERARARTLEAWSQFRSTFLSALGEVEDALAREAAAARRLTALEEQLDLADRRLEAARLRYTQGLDDYLQVLTAIQNAQNLERVLLSQRAARLIQRVRVVRALGGSWTGELLEADPDAPLDESTLSGTALEGSQA
ncbi:MAG: efflux transporter outer membrane subunit [Planctomycetota bacterium]